MKLLPGKFLGLLLVIGCVIPGKAQETKAPPGVKYHVRVKQFEGHLMRKAFLLQAEKDRLVLLDDQESFRTYVPVLNIDYLEFRKARGNGFALLGGAAGGLAISLAVLAATPVNQASPLILALPLITTPLGAAMGTAISKPKTVIHLHGNPAVYEQVRGELVRYTLEF
ncbi:hypothetical protein [Lewinella sp. W8]|uniref:hypothetical protein n=1 Tax=Lewinella sp. W8 TaxID=2528208 RepID=UPI0010686CF6|nr:hypothetical protein [Lewinella sp. W8]MTB50336.1 hypothetical protein [Lewinella sp. W8]